MRIFGFECNPIWRAKILEEVFISNLNQKNLIDKAIIKNSYAKYFESLLVFSILFVYINLIG